MKLRHWNYADILTISALEEECFPREPWSYKELVSSFENEAFCGVLAEEEGEIIGYGGIVTAADTADIENIAVTENYRRGGVGEAILKRLLSEAVARGAKRAYLEVRVSNYPAMTMYLKNGFVGVYARTRYYSDGEDCLVMKKEL